MVILEFKLKGKQQQFTAVDEAIRTTQFIRNKCVRLWQDTPAATLADLNKYCRILAHEHDFVRKLNSIGPPGCCGTCRCSHHGFLQKLPEEEVFS